MYGQNPPQIKQSGPSQRPPSSSYVEIIHTDVLEEEAEALKTLLSGDISIKEESVEVEAEGSEVEVINVEGDDE